MLSNPLAGIRRLAGLCGANLGAGFSQLEGIETLSAEDLLVSWRGEKIFGLFLAASVTDRKGAAAFGWKMGGGNDPIDLAHPLRSMVNEQRASLKLDDSVETRFAGVPAQKHPDRTINLADHRSGFALFQSLPHGPLPVARGGLPAACMRDSF